MTSKLSDTLNSSAYGGEGWRSRDRSHQEELGRVWASCGIDSEWKPLRTVLLHRPGPELGAAAEDPGSVLMLDWIDVARAQDEHDGLVEQYRLQGVEVFLLDPATKVSPNQMFCADLFAMTPQGAVLARPASTVRRGEERVMAKRLADLGVPILKTFTGHATFEGADLMWVDEERVLLGLGLRTNHEALAQISPLMQEIGVTVVAVDMPVGTMHLMGMLRVVDRDLAIAWPRRTPHAAVITLRDAGYEVVFLPDSAEVQVNRAFNFVTLGPRRILMVEGDPKTQGFYESRGIECVVTPTSELGKAAGSIGCLTGIVFRET